MAISLGELELKVKANIDEVKSQIQQLDGEQVEVTVSVETEGLTAAETRLKALEGTRTVTVSADTDESVEETKEETDALGGDRQATAKADTDDSVDTTKEAVDALGGDREANAKATEDETVATVQAAIDELGDDQEATAKAVEDESIATVQSSIEALGTDQNSTVTATEDGSVTTALADIEALGEDQDASVSATDDGSIADVQSDLDALSDDQDASVGAADDGTIASTQTELDALSEDQSASVDVSDNGTIDAVVADLGTIPESVDVTANVEQKITASISGVDTATLESLNTSSKDFKDAADTLADSEGSGWIGKFGGFVGNLVTGIVDFGKSVVSFVAAQADTADEYATQATIAGMSTAEIYRLNWMAGVMDVEPQQIIQATREINTNRKTEDAWLASSAYQVTGLSYEEALGMSGFSIAEMVMKSIAEMPASEREMAAVSAFGNRGTSLLPMIAQMSTGAYDDYIARYSTGIYGAATSDINLDALLELADAKDELNTSLNALKTFVAGLLAPGLTAACDAITALVENISGILLDEEMTPEEKGKAIWESIKETFNTTVKSFQDWIDGLWEIIQPILETLWYAISDALVEALSNLWLNVVRNMTTAQRKLFGVELTGYEANERNIIFGKDTDINSQAWYNQRYHLGASNTEKVTENMAEYLNDYFGENFLADGTPAQAKFDELLEASDNLGAFIDAVVSTDWTQYYETTADKLKRQRVETREREATEKAAAEQQAAEAAAAAEEAAAAAEQAASDAAAAAETAANSEVKMDVNVENNISIRGNDVVVEDVGTSTEVEEYKKKKAATHQYSSAAAHATGNY